MIKVANEHNATYVDNGALSGPEHSMCAPQNMRWMHPWTVQNVSWPGTPLHNTPWGADAMADTLVNAIKAAGRDTGTPDAPTLARTLPSTTPTQMTSQILSYSGVTRYAFKCRLDNAPYATCPSSPVTRSSLSAGPHSYSVIQIDPNGNRSPAAILTWTVDTTTPQFPRSHEPALFHSDELHDADDHVHGCGVWRHFQVQTRFGELRRVPEQPGSAGWTVRRLPHLFRHPDRRRRQRQPRRKRDLDREHDRPACTHGHAHKPECGRHQLHDSGDHLLRQPGRRDVPMLTQFGAAHELPEQSAHSDRPRKPRTHIQRHAD